MKKLTTLSLLGALSVAFAASASAQVITNYATVEKQFAQASQPQVQDLMGWYAGRCYEKKGAQEIVTGGLSIETRDHEGIELNMYSESLTFFDNMSTYVMSELLKTHSLMQYNLSAPRVDKGSVLVEFHYDGEDAASYFYRFRMYNHFPIVNIIAKPNGDFPGSVRYCYFSKKVM